MEEQLAKCKEEIRLLKRLLDKEQLEREKIAKDLHSKKGGLVDLNFKFHTLESDASNGKLNLDIIQDQKNTTLKVIDDLRLIQNEIYPNHIHSSGLISRIRIFLQQCDEKYDTFTVVDTKVTEKLSIPQLKELGLYKTCTAIIKFMYTRNVTDLIAKISIRDTFLDFEISGVSKITNIESSGLKIQLDNIFGLIVWQDAIISKTTNWEDKIKITFKIY